MSSLYAHGMGLSSILRRLRRANGNGVLFAAKGARMAVFDDFLKLDIRAGEIVRAEAFPKAKKPAYKLWVDFGEEIGVLQSSAQITECYALEDLVGKQVMGVVNFPPRKVADFSSEALVLGVYAEQGVVLITPTEKVRNGVKLG